MERKLNYKFQKHDARDYKYSLSKKTVLLPNSFSLNNKVKTILNQGDLGSCVSNSFAQVINMSTNSIWISRLMHYYCGRAIEGTSSLDDSGLDIRQAASIIAKYGACLESVWPYNIYNFYKLPSLAAFQKSKLFKSYKYSFVNQDINSLTTCLYNTKNPIIFGIMVYSSFLTNSVASTGMVPMPDTTNETLEGGHCIIMIGYDNTKQLFTCVNSWGNGWGNKGLFYLPYAYVTNPNLAADFCSLNFTY
jgi:C1A family cysteine protease